MRIIAIRPRPVAIAFSLIYGVAGLWAFAEFDRVTELTLLTCPVGVLVPFIHFNLNLNISREIVSAQPVMVAIAAVLSYAASGCITGTVFIYMFNFIAGLMGGIDARFVKTAEEQETPKLSI
jgi:hypothetical protein